MQKADDVMEQDSILPRKSKKEKEEEEVKGDVLELLTKGSEERKMLY